MSEPAARVTAAEISRLAGVTRGTVSNWRRRHADFPMPTAGTDSRPAYDLEVVLAWLAARGHQQTDSPVDALRTTLRAHGVSPVADGTAAIWLLALVPAIAQLDKSELERLAGLADADLPRQLLAAVRPYLSASDVVSDVPAPKVQSPVTLRALLRCLGAVGAMKTLDVFAEHLANDSASGAYPTPMPLAELMAALITRVDGTVPAMVFDPACGTGGLLAAAARSGAKELFGQDISRARAVQAAVRLGLVAPDSHSVIRSADSLRSDAFPDLTAEAVLCNPPYGVRDWGHDELAYDSRWEYGLPPRAESELAWVQHCLAHLGPGGTAVVLMPPAAAERASGRRVRAELIRNGLLRAVLALPSGIAPPLHVGLHLWLISSSGTRKAEAQLVLFVDAAASRTDSSDIGQAGWERLRETLVDAWRAFGEDPDGFESIPGVACTRAVVDLLDDAVDLTPARHVRTSLITDEPDRYAEGAHAVRSRLRRAGHALVALSGGQDWPPVGAQPLRWRTATVADLIRGGALVLRRAAVPLRAPRSEAAVPPTEADERAVLTAGDVSIGRTASSLSSQERLAEYVEIRQGDVVLPETLSKTQATVARVADDSDDGALLGAHLHLLRPDPERLDPWFLAGFLAAEENLHGATSGTTIVRVDPRRLRVPLLPLDQQRAYGLAFRRLRAVRTAADLAARLADQTTRELATGLTSGTLLPPHSRSP